MRKIFTRTFNNILSLSICIYIFFCISTTIAQDSKLILSPSMVTNESGFGNAGSMVDEQAIAGDPGNGNGGAPSTKWKVGYSASYFPASAYIDLGSMTDISRIYFYDYNNVKDMIIEYGEPGNWQYLLTEPLDKYKKWKEHFVSCNTRYIRFTHTGSGAYFTEVVVYVNSVAPQIPSISDFQSDSIFENIAYLQWTDVVTDSLIGNITEYDFRYSTEIITEQNFYSRASYPLINIPDSAGTVQYAQIPNLQANKIYFFALKVVGDIPNTNPNLYGGASIRCSDMSNVIEITTLASQTQGEYRLVLEPSQVLNEHSFGFPERMIDEQLLCGDPANSSYEPTTCSSSDINSSLFPVSSYIDLRAIHHIKKIYLFDLNGSAYVNIEYGEPGNWQFLLSDPLDSYKNWELHNVDIFTRYLRFTLTDGAAHFAELVLYAYDNGVNPTESKIYMDPSMVNNLSGFGDAGNLVDEQILSGDPANSPGGNPSEKWSTGFQSSIPYPCYAVIDLGKPYTLSKVFLYDVNATGEFTVDIGTQVEWIPIISDQLTGYLAWNQHNVAVTTRYLRIGKHTPTSNVSEIIIYGFDYYQNVIDTIPPAKVIDLIVIDSTTNSISLSWTATGDDEFEGTASIYDIRYSYLPITEQNFDQAKKISNSIVIEEGGTTQNICIDSLYSRTPYYFALYAYDDFQNKSELSNLAFGETELEIGGAVQKVILTEEMILNEWVQGDATLLVDEQFSAGDPANNQGGMVSNRWDMNCGDWLYPGSAFIDLGADYFITEIFLFDDEDDENDTIPGPVTISLGSPFNWTSSYTDSLLNSNTWNSYVVDTQSRYIRVTLENEETRFSEIVVYGYAMTNIQPEPSETEHSIAPMEEIIGVNAFVNAPLGRLQVCGTIREYHRWMWIEGNLSSSYPGYPNNENEWYSPSTGWDFDNFYQNINNMGIICSPAVQNSTMWIAEGEYNRLNHKPISENENPLSPESYVEHGDHMFQFAARYGSTQIDTSLLKLNPILQPLTGLNYVSYYENWNEQDRWWDGRGGFFLPYEYAAMSSADCDGHLDSLGSSIGLKNADPNAKFVMSGIANPQLDYIRALKLWSDYYRNGDFPWDVINVHNYSNDGGTQYAGDVGISPEDDALKERLEEFVHYRNKYLPGVEVWITEFGYDTHANSNQRAPAIGTFSIEEVQAQWIIRSYFAIAAAKLDKAHMYMLADVDVNSSTNYKTSGLLLPDDSFWLPKTSWYYVYTMKNRLKGFFFDSEIPSGDNDVMVYKFTNQTPNISVYAVWCPTSNQNTVEDFSLQLSPNEIQALLVEMQVNSTVGVETIIPINNYTVDIDVCERPVFVVVTDGSNFPVIEGGLTKLLLDTSMMVDESGHGGVAAYVDEQNIAGDPYFGFGGHPSNSWATPYSSTTYPYSCYIDLGQEYNIGNIYIYDKNSSGDLTFSYGTPGNWTPIFTDPCRRYLAWIPHIIDINTRYIRISKEVPTASVAEIVIYVK